MVIKIILDKEVNIKVNSKTISYYRGLGYEIPTTKNKYGKIVYDKSKYITVKIADVTKSSTVMVNVQCDRCNTKYIKRFCDYNYVVDDGDVYTCNNCSSIKAKETCIKRYGVDSYTKTDEYKKKVKSTNLEKYGVEHVLQNKNIKQKQENTMIEKYGVSNPKQCEIFKEKAKNTTIEHYGVENPMQNQSIKNKVIKTNIYKYGVTNPMCSQEIQERAKKTLLDRYGVDSPLKSEEIHNKAKQTLLNNYGVDNPLKSDVIREKQASTLLEKYGFNNTLKIPEVQEKIKCSLFKNGTCKTSKQQSYICNLYNGIINYPFMNYNLDVLIDNNIDVEYDGSGHDLSLKLGNVSEEEFKKKELIRNNILKRNGYLCIRLISSTDKLPSDEVLLKILSLSKEYFNTTNHTWIEWYFDENKFRNADNIEGTFYDFGKLRRISA